MRQVRWALPGGGLLVALLLVVGLLAFVVLIVDDDERTQANAPCGAGGPPIVPAAAAAPLAGVVAGYSGVQLTNAAAIMRAGADLGVSGHGQTIGVMTAMGESGLRVLDYGDLAGPDSRGLFQQRAVGWGSLADRMDPYISATNFFRALLAVPGWDTLTPTLAAHRTQRNADPNHYAKYWAPATQVVAALGGGIAPAPGSGAVPCQQLPVAAGGNLPAGTWTKPAIGRFSSGFGMRDGAPHNGIDLAAPLGTPVVAAADGVVVGVCLTNSTPCTGYGTLITVDHGGGVVTRYAHAYVPDVLVRVGDRVTAGQQLSRIGSNGQSTGPHLHFEVRVADHFTDPVPFLRARGVDLTAA